MQTSEIKQSRVRRAVNDFVLAEMFLVQATIESATAIGEGINDLSRQISGKADPRDDQPLTELFKRTREEALEPYTTHFNYLRKLIDSDS